MEILPVMIVWWVMLMDDGEDCVHLSYRAGAHPNDNYTDRTCRDNNEICVLLSSCRERERVLSDTTSN